MLELRSGTEVLSYKASQHANAPGSKDGVYMYNEMRTSHVSELRVKTNGSYKIFSIRRKDERKIILPNDLQTEFQITFHYSKLGSLKKYQFDL
jgi:hypothetical protein